MNKKNEERDRFARCGKARHQNEVREGQENSSIDGDPQPLHRHEYPRPKLSDIQYKRQPEFTEPSCSRTDEKLEQDRVAMRDGFIEDIE